MTVQDKIKDELLKIKMRDEIEEDFKNPAFLVGMGMGIAALIIAVSLMML